MAKIRVERIPVGKLFEFAQNAEKNQERYVILPIPALRALAQSKNPVASTDDIGLLVAYSGDNCIGYLGILPSLFCHKGKLSKVYALSTFFVDEAYRGLSVAPMIMANAIALEKDLLLAGLTPAAEKFYLKNPQWFKPAGSLPYLHINLLPWSSLLWWLKNRLKAMRGLFNSLFVANRRIADAGSWRFFYHFLRPPACNRCGGVGARLVSEVLAPEKKTGCKLAEGQYYFYRDVDTVNWMIRYPWITENTTATFNYFFSYQRELFRFLPFELYSKQSGERLGYVVFSITKKKGLTLLKILDHALAEEVHILCILDLALREASRWRAELIVGPYKLWPYIKTYPPLRLLTQRYQRGYFIHSSPKKTIFPEDASELCLDYCDGDLPYT